MPGADAPTGLPVVDAARLWYRGVQLLDSLPSGMRSRLNDPVAPGTQMDATGPGGDHALAVELAAVRASMEAAQTASGESPVDSQPAPYSPPPATLPVPWTPPATDQEWQDWQDSSGTGSVPVDTVTWGWDVPPAGFVQGNFPIPSVEVAPVSVAVSAVARILGAVGMIFWPSRTADDDVVIWEDPLPRPKGPPKRPRVRTPQPYGWPLPDWYNWARRRRPPKGVPGVPYPDVDVPYEPQTRPMGDPFPFPIPRSRPAAQPRPGTRPRTTPAPKVPTGWPDLLPYLVPFVMPGQPMPNVPGMTNRPVPTPSNPFGPAPLTPSEPSGVDLPQPFSSPQPYRADPCNCAAQDTKPKRKKSSCSNPISSKRTFMRGGAKYRTITRRLKCQA